MNGWAAMAALILPLIPTNSNQVGSSENSHLDRQLPHFQQSVRGTKIRGPVFSAPETLQRVNSHPFTKPPSLPLVYFFTAVAWNNRHHRGQCHLRRRRRRRWRRVTRLEAELIEEATIQTPILFQSEGMATRNPNPNHRGATLMAEDVVTIHFHAGTPDYVMNYQRARRKRMKSNQTISQLQANIELAEEETALLSTRPQDVAMAWYSLHWMEKADCSTAEKVGTDTDTSRDSGHGSFKTLDMGLGEIGRQITQYNPHAKSERGYPKGENYGASLLRTSQTVTMLKQCSA